MPSTLGAINQMRVRTALFVVALSAGLSWSCSDQPVESTMGPSSGTIDSVAWRARMAHRPGLMLSEAMTTCGNGATCTFAPTNFHCGGQKVECSLQTAPITNTPTSMTPKTLVVSGSGALLCNNTMGKVIAYDALNEAIDSVNLVPIDPSDCGADNITFGGTGTMTWEPGIDHVVISTPSPLTFPVQGGGTGIMSAFYTVDLNDEAIPFTVSCPATAVRADSITCTATAVTGAAVTRWMWRSDTGGWTYERATDATALTWTGQIVGSGRVEVSGTLNGHSFPLPATSNLIAVQPRNWGPTPKVVNIISPNNLPSQPRDTAGALGATLNTLQDITPSPVGFVNDGGPNQGYFYWKSFPVRLIHDVSINASMDAQQPFYNLQYLDPGMKIKVKGVTTQWCGRGSVFPLRTIIRQHEGTQSELDSHVGWTDTTVDHAMPRVEEVGDPNGGPVNLLDSIRIHMHIVDSIYDLPGNTKNPFQIDGLRQVLLPNNYRCRFQYWP